MHRGFPHDEAACFAYVEYKDYRLINYTLTLTVGQTVGDKQCSQLLLLDDDFVESDEIMIISIDAASNGTVNINPPNITTTILQDPNDSQL